MNGILSNLSKLAQLRLSELKEEGLSSPELIDEAHYISKGRPRRDRPLLLSPLALSFIAIRCSCRSHDHIHSSYPFLSVQALC
jgi:hypothetical protein